MKIMAGGSRRRAECPGRRKSGRGTPVVVVGADFGYTVRDTPRSFPPTLPRSPAMPVRASRRQFLKQTAIAGAALSIPAASWLRVLGANGQLRVASVGT